MALGNVPIDYVGDRHRGVRVRFVLRRIRNLLLALLSVAHRSNDQRVDALSQNWDGVRAAGHVR
jgi:hypothetical protein